MADKYKPINTPSSNIPNAYLSRVEYPNVGANIPRMEERKEGSNIPGISHTERMRNNVNRLNLLSVHDSPNKAKPNQPVKGILKKNLNQANTISPITSHNLKANTLANSMSGTYKGY